jgi:hypothetical protein
MGELKWRSSFVQSNQIYAATPQIEASGFIVMSMKSLFEIPGGQSQVRFHTGVTLDFVVRTFVMATALDHRRDKSEQGQEQHSWGD